MMTQIRPGRVQTQPAWREQKQQPHSENVRVVCLGLTFYEALRLSDPLQNFQLRWVQINVCALHHTHSPLHSIHLTYTRVKGGTDAWGCGFLRTRVKTSMLSCGYYWNRKNGANRARTSASSKHFTRRTGWSSNGAENNDRRSSTRAEPARLLGRRS